MENAEQIMGVIGQELHLDYNRFTVAVDDTLQSLGVRLQRQEPHPRCGELAERAAKVVKKVHVLKGKKLAHLLETLVRDTLPDYGYWPTATSGEYRVRGGRRPTARDGERAAARTIHCLFLREVRPHVADAWIAAEQDAHRLRDQLQQVLLPPHASALAGENRRRDLAVGGGDGWAAQAVGWVFGGGLMLGISSYPTYENTEGGWFARCTFTLASEAAKAHSFSESTFGQSRKRRNRHLSSHGSRFSLWYLRLD